MDEQLISDAELDELLKGRDPLNTAGWDARELGSALAHLAQDTFGASDDKLPRARPRRVQRRLITAGASSILVAAAALAGFGVFGGGTTTRSLLLGTQLPAAQAAELNRIAAATAAGASVGRGKWLYLKVVTTAHQGVQMRNSPILFYSVTKTVQNWSANASGRIRVRVVSSRFSFASPRAQSVYASHPAFARELASLPIPPKRITIADAVLPRNATINPTEVGNGTAAKVPLSSLPSNPEALIELFGSKARKSVHPGSVQLSARQRKQQQSFISNNQALSEWIALSQILIASSSEQQRAEAYRALTLVPFVRVVGRRRDSRGRLGTAVSFHLPGAGSPTETLIVNPRTGDLLQDNNGSGSLTVWLARAVVDSDTDLPDGGKQPLSHSSSQRERLAIFGFLLGGGLGG